MRPMRRKFIVLILSCLLFAGKYTYAQTDSTSKSLSADSLSVALRNAENNPEDEEFNLFLLAILLVAVCAMVGAAIVGAFAAAALLFLVIAFIGVGILSVSILATLYKRSVTAGFKTFLYIICPLAGVVIGIAGYWIVTRLFTLSIPGTTGLIAAGVGGILGGLLMAFVVSKIVITSLRFFWKKFNQTNQDNRK